MEGGIDLVAELAIILVAAGVFTLISKWLKQPLILGYIIAGFIVGPHLGLFPQAGSTEAVEQWSEIGIIFLLFALGLEFSFKKLLKVGSSAVITAGVKCIGMFIVGITAGSLMGWTHMESIFLGGLLSMSSTTIIIKAYDDMGLKKKPYATLIFGSLVIEDLIAVLLMVLLSTMAVSNKFAGGEMILSLGKLVFYIVLWFLFGIYLIPTVLKKAKRYLNDEILLILSIGLCFLMVTLASAAGFSSALGAFVMGSILAETIEGERIEHLMGGIKNLFGAIFFVSVGMMIDPAVIAQHWGPVLIITIVAMGGILVFSTGGALLAGQGLETAVHAGFSLAQLGEFAFIIAQLGCSLGVMRDFIYPVVIAVSVLTTFTTPYMIKASGPVYQWLLRVLPSSVLEKISRPRETSGGSAAEKSEWARLLKSVGLRTVLYSVILIAVVTASKNFLPLLISKLLPSVGVKVSSVICLVVTLLVMSPLIYGLSISGGAMSGPVKSLVKKKPSNIWPVISLVAGRLLLGIAFIASAVNNLMESKGLSVLAIVLFTVIFVIVAKTLGFKFIDVEKRFMTNLNAKEAAERASEPIASSVRGQLGAYDIAIEKYAVPQDFEYVGKSLREMPFRKAVGVNIVKIQRGGKSIVIPGGGEVVYPGDVLYAVGTRQQLEGFDRVMSESVSTASSKGAESGNSENEFIVDSFTLNEESSLVGRTLRELDMRSSNCMVISVLRGTKFIANPKADFAFAVSDTVWIAGEKASCLWFEK